MLFPIVPPSSSYTAMDIRYHSSFASGTNNTTYTSTGHSIGTAPGANQKRYVVAVWIGNDNGSGNVSSVSIGGSAATVVKAETHGAGGDFVCGAIAYREVSAGTTADISCTFDNSQGGATAAVYSILTDNVTINTTNTSASGTVDTTLSLTQGNAAIAMMGCRGGTPTSTLVAGNYTADAADFGAGNSSLLATASYEVLSSGSSTCNWTEGSTTAKIGIQVQFAYP